MLGNEVYLLRIIDTGNVPLVFFVEVFFMKTIFDGTVVKVQNKHSLNRASANIS